MPASANAGTATLMSRTGYSRIMPEKTPMKHVHSPIIAGASKNAIRTITALCILSKYPWASRLFSGASFLAPRRMRAKNEEDRARGNIVMAEKNVTAVIVNSTGCYLPVGVVTLLRYKITAPQSVIPVIKAITRI